jgi:Fe-S-cluster containining protein
MAMTAPDEARADAATGPATEAAPFATWLRATLATLRDDVPADVPCGDCNACCRTFHQIHIRPGEKRARKRLPREYLSVARGLPPGYLLLGYTEAGACPVLIDGRCMIYEDRPLVCRTYDCRMYAATGIPPDRAEIVSQVLRWRFAYPAPEDRQSQEAVLAAVRFIRECPACLPSEAARRQPIRVATLAVVAHELFLEGATTGMRRRPVTDQDRVRFIAGANEELFGDG